MLGILSDFKATVWMAQAALEASSYSKAMCTFSNEDWSPIHFLSYKPRMFGNWFFPCVITRLNGDWWLVIGDRDKEFWWAKKFAWKNFQAILLHIDWCAYIYLVWKARNHMIHNNADEQQFIFWSLLFNLYSPDPKEQRTWNLLEDPNGSWFDNFGTTVANFSY